MQARVWARIALGLASLVGGGCNSADGSRQDPDLTRRDPEPIGANCALGGTAVHTGADRDADGVLDDNEIIDTVYECNDAPVTLMRDDVLAPSATCPGGGIVTRTGIDDNNDGSLEDPEIDLSTIRCNSLDRWTGDFTAANWSDAVKVTALRGARVVDGSLTIAATGLVELPLLETVHGDLVVRGPMSGLALPALRQVGGGVDVDAPALRTLSLAVLEQIDGELAIERNDELGASLDAPQLRTVGRLVFGANAHGVVSMPRLTIVGALVDDGHLAELHLDALITVAGDVSVGGRGVSVLRLPSLEAIEGALRGDQALLTEIIDLPVLEHIAGDLHLDQLSFLITVSMPSLRHIGGELSLQSVDRLSALDIHNLEDIAGRFKLESADSLPSIAAPKLRAIGAGNVGDSDLSLVLTGLQELDLGALSTISGSISINGNVSLRVVRLPALVQVDGLSIESSPALEAVAVPRVASTTQLRIVTAPVLGTLQLDSLARVTGGVVLFDCAIPDLSGLHALANVGTFGISGAQRLRDVRGLSSLQQVRLLMLAGNPALLSLDGLESISTISATVSISDNPVLTSVAGLRNATSMGSLAISGNALLPRIELTSLVTIHHDLTIASNPAMTTLSGLDALTSVADTLVIEHNDRIPAEEVAAFRTRLGR